MNKFDLLWESVKEEIPGARVILKKDSKFMSVLFFVLTWLVKIFTFGKGKSNWDGFTTTVWRTMYVPDDFWEWTDASRYRLLRHELVHMRQFRNWPMKFLGKKGWWRINAVLMGFSYIFLPLPVFWTLRAKFEREGYLQSMLSYYELYGYTSVVRQRYTEWMGDVFGGSTYFFMWTKGKAKKWAEKTLDDIENKKIINAFDDVLKWAA